MGNESSTPVDESVPPVTLKTRTLEGVADYIKKNDVKRIVVMTGAGISTSAGIPDFRSPDTGLYANLARLNLPYAEAVFDISYFRQNPYPFYTLAHELYPGKYQPTITHSFISLLNKKGKLLKLFTQNIDCLEREAGVPDDKIVEAHGSFAKQRCIECSTEFPDDKMRNIVEKKEVPHCIRKSCNGLVKPDIVFFGEALPAAFHNNIRLPATADLAIIMGTSLTVQPFANLPAFVKEDTPRVLINMERVGGLGSRPDDVLVIGDCDEGVRKFADALGWRDELEQMRKSMNSEKSESEQEEVQPKSKQDALDERINELTKDIDKTLKLSEVHLNDRQKEQVKADLTGQGEVKADTVSLSHVYPHIDSTDKKPSLLARLITLSRLRKNCRSGTFCHHNFESTTLAGFQSSLCTLIKLGVGKVIDQHQKSIKVDHNKLVMPSATLSATPEVVLNKKFDSPFNSRSLVITIGRARRAFTIHEAKLAETSFFDVHGAPSKIRSKQSTDENRDPVQFKLENGTMDLMCPAQEEDYHLEDRFLLDPLAFDVFARHLYNEPPAEPSSHKEVKILLKAYGIAKMYKCYSLQNGVLGCIRRYHRRTEAILDDLIWCANRFGDNTQCQLTAYMVDQIAYEIALGNFDEFCKGNVFMRRFLEEGDRVIRLSLFKALAKHGRDSTADDPAKGHSRYNVHETGEFAGQLTK